MKINFCSIDIWILLLVKFSFINMSVNTELEKDKGKVESLYYLIPIHSSDGFKSETKPNQLFNERNKNDRKCIVNFCSKIIGAVLKKNLVHVFFNNKLFYWIDQIAIKIKFFEEKYTFLAEKHQFYLEEQKNLKYVNLSPHELQKRLKEIDLKFYTICEEEINNLFLNNEECIELLKDIVSSVNFFERVFWIFKFKVDVFQANLKQLLNIEQAFSYVFKTMYVEPLKKQQEKSAVFVNRFLNGLKISIEMSKEQFLNLKACLIFFKELFEINCFSDYSDLAMRMTEVYLFDCFYTKSRSIEFKSIMHEYIEAINDLKKEEKLELKASFVEIEEEIGNVIISICEKHKTKECLL